MKDLVTDFRHDHRFFCSNQKLFCYSAVHCYVKTYLIYARLKSGFLAPIFRYRFIFLTTRELDDHALSKIFGVIVEPVPPPVVPGHASLMSVRRRKAS